MGKVYLGDFGTLIDLDVGEDVSAATELRIQALKPDGTTVVAWIPALIGETILRYPLATGDLDQTGTWKFQAKVTNSDGVWYGETAPLRVYPLFG